MWCTVRLPDEQRKWSQGEMDRKRRVFGYVHATMQPPSARTVMTVFRKSKEYGVQSWAARPYLCLECWRNEKESTKVQ